jgi:uncharacterized caspase-like protein
VEGYRALLITNWEFPNDESNKLHPLRGPKTDGDHLRGALTHGSFGLFDDKNVATCANETNEAIRTAIDDLVTSAHREDTLLLYYSGHGLLAASQLYLCARDTNGARVNVLGLGASWIHDTIDGWNRGGRVIIVLDCCYAGAFDNEKGGPDSEQILKDVFAEGQFVLSSSDAYSTSKDAKEEGLPSPFTEALAEELVSPSLKADHGQFVTIDQIYERLDMRYGQKRLPIRPQRTAQGAGAIQIARRDFDQEAQPPDADFGKYEAVVFHEVLLRIQES